MTDVRSPDGVHRIRLTPARNAFSPRRRARAADVWRLFQELAVEGSTQAGWSPERYHATDSGFLVRRMSVVHDREITYGEALDGRTWVSALRRDMFCTRQVRLESGGGSVARGTQQWVHVGPGLAPSRASAELRDAFPILELEPSVELPAYAPIEPPGAPIARFEFDAWHTWMDPLDHVNHPAYVDFVDEATSRVMARAGLDPVLLRPVAEEATYRAGVRAGDRVLVESEVIGATRSGAVALAHRILVDGRRCAELTTWRALEEASPTRLLEAFRGSEEA